MFFFPASKIAWGIFAPSHLLLWSVIAAAVLMMTRHRRAGQYLCVGAAVAFIIMGALPTSLWALSTIEGRYPKPLLPKRVDGILTLGGGFDYRARLVGAYALAVRYPNARVVYSGGSSALIDNKPGRDAKNAKNILIALGLKADRLLIEDRSRNTWENMLFTQRLVKPRPGDTWILATSALQLPRAMEIANRLHWKLLPWPTDSVSGETEVSGFPDIAQNLMWFDNAVREWVGLVAYRVSGKSSSSAVYK